MARSKETYNKKEVQKKKEKKRKDKEKKRLDRRDVHRDGNNLDDMIAYIDEFGNITSTPGDLSKRSKIKAEDIEISVTRNTNLEPEEKTRRGTVAFFNTSKGYGFIKDNASKESIFVHINGLVDPISENNSVTFEVEKGPKGLNAFNVKLDKS
jgi:cold shock CspA family protein